MTRRLRHDDETAAKAMADITFDIAEQKRKRRIKHIRKQHKRLDLDKLRLAQIRQELSQPGASMKRIGQAYGVPHHYVVYVWRNT